MIAQHRVFRRYLSTGPVTAAYEVKVEAGELQRDEAQIALAAKLDALHQALTSLPVASARSIPAVRGMYIHGSVGVGKSFLMDLFYALVAVPHDDDDDDDDDKDDSRWWNDKQKRKYATINKRRVHFHEFMLDVHHRIFVYKKKHPRGDAIPFIAQQLAQEAQLLCFDEFQVTDIADAMILKRLFLLLLLEWKVVVVATSNRPPDGLYEGGLNRSLFLPFINVLKQTSDVVNMDEEDASSQKDYRRDTVTGGQSYCWSSNRNSTNSKAHIYAQMEVIFGPPSSKTEAEVIPVPFGRNLQISRSNDRCAWFTFAELCLRPLGAADYISVCRRFPILLVDAVPQLNSNHLNEARRLVTLIDACYESRTRLVLAAKVPLDALFVDFEAQVQSTESDGDEELMVVGEGGSSSSHATTMIRTGGGGGQDSMEWSATGRVGVSLAQLSGANDVSFSFRRAASRLVEMGGKEWGRQ